MAVATASVRTIPQILKAPSYPAETVVAFSRQHCTYFPPAALTTTLGPVTSRKGFASRGS